ncbi:hypothetical protein ACIQOW_24450 [Kitasatospora sp. NPDC091335]|uniref:hypothetical protein n=1 Tax=Kitasatospora sp. NPDC091335 TaxID=3364085 RepID=UPI0038241B86
MAMTPPSNAEDFTFTLDDALDIPVRVRSDGDLTRWREPGRTKAAQPWPHAHGLPGDGEYLVTTTWRQLVDAATSVGRDLTPWLRRTPSLAVNELVARVSPLHAYLSLRDFPVPAGKGAGRRLFVSAVYRHGTERSAHSAFGYHLGMTMAQWLTVGMAGLPSTVHLEGGGVPEFTDASEKLPDLYGNHPAEELPWLIEAKGRKHLGKQRLSEGQEQLDGGSAAMAVPHRQVLCGTSLPRADRWEDDPLFMMVNTAVVVPPPGGGTVHHLPDPPSGDDEEQAPSSPDALLRVARRQLLVYRALAFGAVQDRRMIRLSGPGHREGRARSGANRTLPLEFDTGTRYLRESPRRHGVPDAWADRMEGARTFLVGRIPGVGLHLGMSSGLYAACAALHRAQAEVPADEPVFPPDVPLAGLDEDDRREERSRRARRTFYDREHELLPRTKRDMADAYGEAERAPEGPVGTGFRPEPPDPVRELLEARTAETYLAIEPTDPVLAPYRR